MTENHPDVRLTGPMEQVLAVEEALGDNVIVMLAYAARQHDVMISLTVSPYTNDETNEGSTRDPNDA